MKISRKQNIVKILEDRVEKKRQILKKVIRHIRGPQSIFTQDETTKESGIINLLTIGLIHHFRTDPANKLLKFAQNNRYLFRSKKNNSPKITSGPKIQFNELMHQDDDARFKKEVRMSKTAFNKLCELLKEHPEYKYKGVGRRQFDIGIQVMIALNILGTSRTDASHTAVSKRYSISDGQVDQIMKRFLTVIISFKDKFLVWPTGRERLQTINDYQRISGFTGCIGFVDAFLLDLGEKPIYQPENFFCHNKQKFMANATMVCDYNLKIIYAQAGDYGSVHDARVLREGDLGRNASELFSPDQFILGDSAYPLKSWILPLKQHNYHKKELSGSDIKFNKYISKMRVRVENCFAAVKSRFPSIDLLNIKIRTEKDIERLNEWFIVCCSLHNFCLEMDSF